MERILYHQNGIIFISMLTGRHDTYFTNFDFFLFDDSGYNHPMPVNVIGETKKGIQKNRYFFLFSHCHVFLFA